MAAGDVYTQGPTSVADQAYLDVQPSAGTEIVIHNIWHEGDVTISRYDGSNDLPCGSLPGPMVESRLAMHCTNTNRFRIRNTAGSPKLIAVDGVYTK